MKVVYFIPDNAGHFSHMFPFYKELGGLIFVDSDKVRKQIMKEYNITNITESIDFVKEYNPDVIMYTDFYYLDFPRAKHIQVFHGVSDKLYYYTANSSLALPKYDLCLLTGDVMKDKFKFFGWDIKEEVTGYSKFDSIRKTNLEPFKNKKRKTVLYAPTFNDFSSLPRFHTEIKKLSEKYNIIVKLHSQSGVVDKCGEQVDYLINSANDKIMVYNCIDIMPFINGCDAVITDISAVAYESLFFNKPIIFANPNDHVYRPMNHILRSTYIWKVGEICDDPKNLQAVVDNAIENDKKEKLRCKIFGQTFYKDSSKNATQLGIEAINKLFKK